jgi:hypothetical protein
MGETNFPDLSLSLTARREKRGFVERDGAGSGLNALPAGKSCGSDEKVGEDGAVQEAAFSLNNPAKFFE